MNRQRPQASRKKAAPKQAQPAVPAARNLPLLRQEVVGGALLLLALLTLLGLMRVSGGAVLGGWAGFVRKLFGWGSIPFTLIAGLVGLRLLWKDLRQSLRLGPAAWVGIELLLLVLVTAAHAPQVLRSGADAALLTAKQGQAGGLVGWALAVPLIGGLGSVVGSLLLFVAFVVALALLLPLSRTDLKDWFHRLGRTIAAAVGRFRTARQGTAVAPDLVEVPWWEQEAEPAAVKPVRRAGGRTARALQPSRRKAVTQPEDGILPPLDLLNAASPQAYGDTDVRRKTQIIEETLESFGVPARVVEIQQGPTVTQFGLDPGFIERRASDGQVARQRVRVGRIVSLVDDLSLALAAAPLRIEAPVPGRSLVGLEVPNDKVSLVSLRRVMESGEFQGIRSRLAIALGEDVAGHPVAIDLSLMPHLLIAGATGSGKSVCINAIVCCLLLRNTPADLKMLMVDPKMVELVNYNGSPHLLAPVIIDVEDVVRALAWVAQQMDERYRLLHKFGVRNIDQYNQRISRFKQGETLPTLVVLIDELADMMMMAPDEVERHICRLAQMGRATGIHLVIATQRPSVDVVTGLIKANFPARISFAVTSQVDSRVILDRPGAESLLGRGDMLFTAPQRAAPTRLQGCFVSDEEIERLNAFWRGQKEEDDPQPSAPWVGGEEVEGGDDLLERAIEVTRGRGRISTSFIQRQLKIGFPRAARLMDLLEEQGIVGPDEGAGRGRAVLSDGRIDLDRIDERLPGVEPH
jgi:S-DNA-T family DNA segregation ATPase FtsK/SpoIIIE